MKSFPFFAALGVCALVGFHAQADVVDLTYRVSAPGSNELVNVGGTSCALTNRAPDDARELPKFNAERPYFGRVFGNRLAVLDKSAPEGKVWDTTVTLSAGSQTEDFPIKPLPLTKITVVDEAGKPVAKAAFRRLSEVIATTDDKGQALVRLQPRSGRGFGGVRVVSDTGELGALLENPAADAKEMTVTLRKSATLTGLVKKPDGSPLAGANAQLIWRTGTWGIFEGAVKTDAEGRYKINSLIPGASYMVQVKAKGYTTVFSRKQATPESGAVVEMEPISLDVATAVLTGRLTDPAGAPVANVQVNLRSTRNERKSAMTDKDGRFKMEELVPEEVWLNGQMPDAGRSLFSRRVAPEEFANLAIVVQPAFDPSARLAMNTPAPELKELDWVQGEWKGFAGRRTVVAFVSIKNRNSREVIKDMQAAVERAKDGSLGGVLVHDSTATVEEIRDFMAKNKITLAVGRVKVEADTGLLTPAFLAYEVSGIPSVFIVNARGRIEAANVAPSELSAQLAGQTE